MLRAFQKNHKERTLEDIKVIISCILKTKLQEVIFETNRDKFKNKLLFYKLAKEIQFEYFEKGNEIFKIGDKGDKFYIILQGNIDILKPLEEYSELSLEDYIGFLINLKNKNEIFFVKNILNANKDIINIEYENIESLNESIFERKLVEFLLKYSPKSQDIENFFKINNKEISTCKLDLNLLKKLENDVNELQTKINNSDKCNEKNKEEDYVIFNLNHDEEDQTTLIDNMNKLSRKIYFIISEYIINQNKYLKEKSKKLELDLKLENLEIRKQYIIYKHAKFLTLKEGFYFGDNALENDCPRNATIIAGDQNAYLATVDKDFYIEYLLKEKVKLANKKIDFVFNSVFNRFMKREIFEKRFFNNFIYEEYFKDQILIKENQKFEYVYFIYEGGLELQTKINYFELEEQMRTLIKFCDEFKDEIYVDDESSKLFKKYNPRKLRNRDFKDEFMNKKSCVIKKIAKNEIFGLENFFFKFQAFHTAIVNTNKLSLFKIDTYSLKKIMYSESLGERNVKNYCSKKIASIVSRLFELKRGMIEFLQDKIATGNIASQNNVSFLNNINLASDFNEKYNKLQTPLTKRKLNWKSSIINSHYKTFFGKNINNIGTMNSNSIIKENKFILNDNMLSDSLNAQKSNISQHKKCISQNFKDYESSNISIKRNIIYDCINMQKMVKLYHLSSSNKTNKKITNYKNNAFKSCKEKNQSKENLKVNFSSENIEKENLDQSSKIQTDSSDSESNYKIEKSKISKNDDIDNPPDSSKQVDKLNSKNILNEKYLQSKDDIEDTSQKLNKINNLDKTDKSISIGVKNPTESELSSRNCHKPNAQIETQVSKISNIKSNSQKFIVSYKNNKSNQEKYIHKKQTLNFKSNFTDKFSKERDIEALNNIRENFRILKKLPKEEIIQSLENKNVNNNKFNYPKKEKILILNSKTGTNFFKNPEISNNHPIDQVNNELLGSQKIPPNTGKKSLNQNSLKKQNNFEKIPNLTKTFINDLNKNSISCKSIKLFNNEVITKKTENIIDLNINKINKKIDQNSLNELPIMLNEHVFKKIPNNPNNRKRILNLNSIDFSSFSSNNGQFSNNIVKNEEFENANKNNICQTARNINNENLKSINIFNSWEELKNYYNLHFAVHPNQNEEEEIIGNSKTFYPKNFLSANNLFWKSNKLQLEKKKSNINENKFFSRKNIRKNQVSMINLTNSSTLNSNLLEKFKGTSIFNRVIRDYSSLNKNEKYNQINNSSTADDFDNNDNEKEKNKHDYYILSNDEYISNNTNKREIGINKNKRILLSRDMSCSYADSKKNVCFLNKNIVSLNKFN